MKHLIIPDSHAHPDYDNDRFEALGEFIVQEAPDIVINIGDFADMPSLSSYDKGRRSAEGRRFEDDVESLRDAQRRLFAPIKKTRKKLNILWVLTLGNHEDRVERATQKDPELYGALSLPFDPLWEKHAFLKKVVLDGIAYSHYFPSGVMGRPISGENIGKTLCMKLHHSAVQGHSHIFDHSERSVINGRKIFGLSCGCFIHPKFKEGWNEPMEHMYWRGVVVLEGVHKGYYDELRAVTMRKIL